MVLTQGERDPDRVLGSPVRWLVLGLTVLLVLVGLFFLVAGVAAAPPPGEDRSLLPPLLGAELVLFGIAGALTQGIPGRRRGGDLPGATADGGGCLLPLRPRARLGRLLTSVALVGLGVTLVVVGAADAAPAAVVVGVLVVLGVVGLAVVSRGRTAHVRLDPEGVTFPGGVTAPRTVPWREVSEVAVVGGWQPHLVLTHQGPGLVACRLTPQAWPPSAIVAAIEHFASHASDRKGLDSPGSLDRFRRA